MRPINPSLLSTGVTLLAVLTLSACPALAATIYVPTDQPTIQAGIDASLNGDIIIVAAGTYVENIDFLCKDIILQSEEGADLTVIDGNQNGSVVTITCGEDVVIDGFTIRNGSGTHFPEAYTAMGGGIFCEYSSATIVNCTIIGNVLIEDSPVGGGIYGRESILTIDNCTITENSSFYPVAAGGDVNGSGGGVCCDASSLSVTNCTITKNRFGNNGGGIRCDTSFVTIDNCTISENRAIEGGGICLSSCWDPPSTITNCTISGNIATQYGGGIKCYTSPLSINNCSITDNSALGYRGFTEGGAIRLYHYSYLTITNSTISGNRVCTQLIGQHTRGGAIYFSGTCDSTITNCIITDNSTENSIEGLGHGGAFYSMASSLTIKNCTLGENSAATEGGAIFFYDTGHTIRNCIFWGNTAPVGPEIFLRGIGYGHGASLEVSYSDVQGGETAVHIDPGGTLHWLDGNIVEEPLFVGGLDYRLSTESPCIDAGDPDPSHNDDCFPPSMGTNRNDMGAYGGPDVCGWCGDLDGDSYDSDICGGDDCDDTYFYAYPGASEICDGNDNDCDGTIPDDEADSDRDDWMICEDDCDDSNPEINPLAEEICDGIDNDCDGITDDRDADEDGFVDQACGGMDCDDADSEVHPGAAEVCDGKDSDCDGIVPEGDEDDDGDGWAICMGDCDDTDPAINPTAEEICEGRIDDDCDGLVDGDDWEECPFLELDAFYLLGSLNLNFRLAVRVHTNWWSTQMILTSPTFQIIPLWTVQLPWTEIPIEIPISFPFPSLGWVGIYSSLTTLQGDQAVDFAWAYAGK